MAEEKKEAIAVTAEEQKADVSKATEATVQAGDAAENKKADVENKPKKAGAINLNFYGQVRSDLPEIRTGDVVRVSYRVIEGGKERIQIFEGIVIAQKCSGMSKTATVRKTSFGIAVERIFPLNSKLVQSIEVKKHSKVRRSKLYFLRDLSGKAARLKESRT